MKYWLAAMLEGRDGGLGLSDAALGLASVHGVLGRLWIRLEHQKDFVGFGIV